MVGAVFGVNYLITILLIFKIYSKIIIFKIPTYTFVKSLFWIQKQAFFIGNNVDFKN